MGKLDNKVTNFGNALHRLQEAAIELNKDVFNDVIRDGLIQRFEFTYELAWKTTKEFMEGIVIVDVNSPKAVIKEAFAQRLITNEQCWLLMLNDRNLTSHVYKEDMAREIAERINTSYIGEFEKLLKKLRA